MARRGGQGQGTLDGFRRGPRPRRRRWSSENSRGKSLAPPRHVRRRKRNRRGPRAPRRRERLAAAARARGGRAVERRALRGGFRSVRRLPRGRRRFDRIGPRRQRLLKRRRGHRRPRDGAGGVLHARRPLRRFGVRNARGPRPAGPVSLTDSARCQKAPRNVSGRPRQADCADAQLGRRNLCKVAQRGDGRRFPEATGHRAARPRALRPETRGPVPAGPAGAPRGGAPASPADAALVRGDTGLLRASFGSCVGGR
mmetsp:Transcript_4396/g.15521  ORF Transcript_4396/g.15521 Transcript_4396/m.15521 type:complete len:255 (-) Transcript_4396:542-1306(-)